MSTEIRIATEDQKDYVHNLIPYYTATICRSI